MRDIFRGASEKLGNGDWGLELWLVIVVPVIAKGSLYFLILIRTRYFSKSSRFDQDTCICMIDLYWRPCQFVKYICGLIPLSMPTFVGLSLHTQVASCDDSMVDQGSTLLGTFAHFSSSLWNKSVENLHVLRSG